MGSVFSVVQGVGSGLVLTQAKRLEDSVRAGGNSYFTAMLQMTQGGF